MSFNARTLVKSTRKEHQCMGCLKDIPVNSIAINNSGYYEDWYNYYLHFECEELIEKHSDFFNEGLWEGCLKDLKDYYGDEVEI